MNLSKVKPNKAGVGVTVPLTRHIVELSTMPSDLSEGAFSYAC